jgi:hypothetical protein
MRHLLLILPICLLFSCKEKEVNVPENILSEQEMVGLLQEIYLTEAKISKLSLPFDSSKVLYDMVEKDLFERYGIQDSVYETSLNWYYEHPDRLLSVYETLVDSLMVFEKRYGDAGLVKDKKKLNR